MKKLHLILTVLLLYSSFSFAQIYYVSNNGSSTSDGSFTNPFDKISAAYNAAVSNGQNEVIKLMPGNYYETNLVFDSENIIFSGYNNGTYYFHIQSKSEKNSVITWSNTTTFQFVKDSAASSIGESRFGIWFK
jgi:hypothetical protein